MFIGRAVQQFFTTGVMPIQMNCATITLVPKVPSPSMAKDLRPIACCTMLYKIISKVLTARLQTVIAGVINVAKSGFIPGRRLSDNVLMATELVKGYTRVAVSPRSMIKKSDSIEWLESVL